jgi:hypothetical protein
VDPTIAAACIAGGVGALGVIATVVTAWIGSRNTRRATEQAIAAGAANTRATLAAAREDRLWDKRAAVYEETLAAVAYRQSGLTAALRDGDASEEELEKALQSYGSFEWAATQGRLNAYASDAVRGASLASVVGHGTARQRFSEMRGLRNQIQSGHLPRGVSLDEEVAKALQSFDGALKAASLADKTLIDAIRDELRSKPEAALQPLTALPAVRRKLRRRHRELYR